MTGDARGKIREYFRFNLDATAGEILGALGLGPEHRETIASIRGDLVSESDGKAPERPLRTCLIERARKQILERATG